VRQVNEGLIMGGLSFLASIIGTFGGIVVSSKLTVYRIEQLEKKVEKHNRLVERTYQNEKEIEVLKNREKVTEHRVEDLEELYAVSGSR
jgi:cell division protein FtsB